MVQKAKISVKAETYTGIIKDTIKQELFQPVDVEQGKDTVFTMTESEAECGDHLMEQANTVLECSAVVEIQNERHMQIFSDITAFRFRRPDLLVEGPAVANVGEAAEFTVTFINPLSVSLIHCDVSYESSGFRDQEDIKETDVPAKGEYSRTFAVTPVADGEHNIGFCFDCKELPDIEGSTTTVIEQ